MEGMSGMLNKIDELKLRSRILAELEKMVEDHNCCDADGNPGPMACFACIDLWEARRRVERYYRARAQLDDERDQWRKRAEIAEEKLRNENLS